MCEPGRRGPPLRAAAGVLVAVAMTGAAVRTAISAAEAIGITILGVCVVAAVLAVAFVARHGGFGVVVQRPVEREAINHTVIRAALPAPRRELEAPGAAVEDVIIEKEAVR